MESIDKYVWIQDEEYEYLPAKILEVQSEKYVVELHFPNDERKVKEISKGEKLHEINYRSLSAPDDLLSLGDFNFNKQVLLFNIRKRFLKKKIYTFIGDLILISINPFKNLGIFNDEVKKLYIDYFNHNYKFSMQNNLYNVNNERLNTNNSLSNNYENENDFARKNKPSPHLYYIAEAAYQDMISYKSNQSIIISGEAGSGKTISTNLIIEYLVSRNLNKVFPNNHFININNSNGSSGLTNNQGDSFDNNIIEDNHDSNKKNQNHLEKHDNISPNLKEYGLKNQIINKSNIDNNFIPPNQSQSEKVLKKYETKSNIFKRSRNNVPKTLMGKLKKNFSNKNIYNTNGNYLIQESNYNIINIDGESHRTVEDRDSSNILDKNKLGKFSSIDSSGTNDEIYYRNSCLNLKKSKQSEKFDVNNIRNSSSLKIHNMLLYASHILESFGNAKTIKNDNSSRFGKFTMLFFDKKGNLIAGKILNYLLENSRVTKQQYDERNFHIFYQLLLGADEIERNKYYLKNIENYYFLNQANLTGSTPNLKIEEFQSDNIRENVEGENKFNFENELRKSQLHNYNQNESKMNNNRNKNSTYKSINSHANSIFDKNKYGDKENFMILKQNFLRLNFQQSVIDNIFKILSAILHLGNLYFFVRIIKDKPFLDVSNKIKINFHNNLTNFSDLNNQNSQNYAINSNKSIDLSDFLDFEINIPEESQNDLKISADLLGLNKESLDHVLTNSNKPYIIQRLIKHFFNPSFTEKQYKEYIIKLLNIKRDEIVKSIYSNLFDFIIKKINLQISNREVKQTLNLDDQVNYKDYFVIHTDSVMSSINNHKTNDFIGDLDKNKIDLTKYQNLSNPENERSSNNFHINRKNLRNNLINFIDDKNLNSNHSKIKNIKKLKKKEKEDDQHYFIGILDIFGFENFELNSLEQLCINYTNERLLQFFIKQIFKNEQQDCINEKIEWSNIDFMDNINIIKMFDDPKSSIFALLEQLGRKDDIDTFNLTSGPVDIDRKNENHQSSKKIFMKSDNMKDISITRLNINDNNTNYTNTHWNNITNSGVVYNNNKISSLDNLFRKKVYEIFANTEYEKYLGDKINGFISINHYAGTVYYDIDGFIEKNINSLNILHANSEIITYFKNSNNEVLKHLFLEPESEKKNTKKIKFECEGYSNANSNKSYLCSTNEKIIESSKNKKFSNKHVSENISKIFKKKLDKLFNFLEYSKPRYIKCIRPCKEVQENQFDSSLVNEQLLSNGLLEALKLRNKGYSYRIKYMDFCERYGILSYSPNTINKIKEKILEIYIQEIEKSSKCEDKFRNDNSPVTRMKLLMCENEQSNQEKLNEQFDELELNSAFNANFDNENDNFRNETFNESNINIDVINNNDLSNMNECKYFNESKICNKYNRPAWNRNNRFSLNLNFEIENKLFYSALKRQTSQILDSSLLENNKNRTTSIQNHDKNLTERKKKRNLSSTNLGKINTLSNMFIDKNLQIQKLSILNKEEIIAAFRNLSIEIIDEIKNFDDEIKELMEANTTKGKAEGESYKIIQFGVSRVFMKEEFKKLLENKRKNIISILLIQSHFRKYFVRKKARFDLAVNKIIKALRRYKCKKENSEKIKTFISQAKERENLNSTHNENSFVINLELHSFTNEKSTRNRRRNSYNCDNGKLRNRVKHRSTLNDLFCEDNYYLDYNKDVSSKISLIKQFYLEKLNNEMTEEINNSKISILNHLKFSNNPNMLNLTLLNKSTNPISTEVDKFELKKFIQSDNKINKSFNHNFNFNIDNFQENFDNEELISLIFSSEYAKKIIEYRNIIVKLRLENENLFSENKKLIASLEEANKKITTIEERLNLENIENNFNLGNLNSSNIMLNTSINRTVSSNVNFNYQHMRNNSNILTNINNNKSLFNNSLCLDDNIYKNDYYLNTNINNTNPNTNIFFTNYEELTRKIKFVQAENLQCKQTLTDFQVINEINEIKIKELKKLNDDLILVNEKSDINFTNKKIIQEISTLYEKITTLEKEKIELNKKLKILEMQNNEKNKKANMMSVSNSYITVSENEQKKNQMNINHKTDYNLLDMNELILIVKRLKKENKILKRKVEELKAKNENTNELLLGEIRTKDMKIEELIHKNSIEEMNKKNFSQKCQEYEKELSFCKKQIKSGDNLIDMKELDKLKKDLENKLCGKNQIIDTLNEKLEDLERELKKNKKMENALKEELKKHDLDMYNKNEKLKSLQQEISVLNDDYINLKRCNLILLSENELIESKNKKYLSESGISEGNNSSFLLKSAEEYSDLSIENLKYQLHKNKEVIFDLKEKIKFLEKEKVQIKALNQHNREKILSLNKEIGDKKVALENFEQKLAKKKKTISLKKRLNLIMVDFVKCKKNELQCIEALKFIDNDKMRKTLETIRTNEKNYLFKMKEISNKEDFSDSSDSDTSQRESEDEDSDNEKIKNELRRILLKTNKNQRE